MAYSVDLRNSAHRHMQAADALFTDASHKAIAGYLYGIAAECAVKALLMQSHMRPLDTSERRDDPLYAHFPQLRTMLRDAPQGRLGTTLRRLIEDDRFMHHWSTDMRYAPGSDVLPKWLADWREQARHAVACIDT